MATNTANYGLKKPSQEDFYNVNDQNTNMDIIDTTLKALADAIASGASEQEIADLRAEVAAHKAEIATPTKLGHVKAETDENGNLILPSSAKVISGTYVGDGIATRTVTTGITPKLLFITTLNRTDYQAQAEVLLYDGTGSSIANHDHNGYAVKNTNQGSSEDLRSKIVANGIELRFSSSGGLNVNGVTYAWIAVV